MSAAKKGKKTKGKSLSLGEFLGATPGGGSNSISGSAAVIVPPKSSWAEESEEFEDERFNPSERIVLPTAPRQARGPAVDPDRVPSSPPYIAYVANLPFEVEDEDICMFFKDLQVVTVRLPREGGEFGRFKGFGYVEFGTRSDLLEALSFNDEMMHNRKIRVDIAEEERGSGRREGGGPRRDDDREDRSGGVSDWRAAPRDSGGDRSPGRDRFDDRDRDRGYGDRDRGRDRSYGDRERGFGDRDRDRGYGDRDRGYGDRDRDRGYGDRDRDRGYGDRDRDRGFGDRDRDRGYGDRDRDRGYGDRDRDRGYGRDRYDNRGYRSGGDRDRYERGYDRGRYGGGGGGGGGGRYEDRRGGGDRGDYRRDDDRWRPRGGRDREEEGDGSAPLKERPRLNLKPRTKPLEESSGAAQEVAPAAANPSIFGAAKPVDTLHRELEIERKLIEGKDTKEPPKREAHTISSKDVFGNAKPVDTSAREREIEEKLKKQDTLPKRDEKDSHNEGKRVPLKLEKREGGQRPLGNKEKIENNKSRDKVERNNEKNNENSSEENEPSDDDDDSSSNLEENKLKKGSTQSKKPLKGKKSKDEDLIINTANKFCQLGLDEEEV